MQENKPAFVQLYDLYSGALFFIILNAVHCNERSEIILQKSFEKIFKTMSNYDPEKSRIFTWMVKITNERIAEHLSADDSFNVEIPMETTARIHSMSSS
jgi:RNA polymerase sigma-70 factor (ECF subfamily)